MEDKKDKQMWVSAETHRMFKTLAARREVSVKEVAAQVLEDYLKQSK